jgi:polyphosphate kinase
MAKKKSTAALTISEVNGVKAVAERPTANETTDETTDETADKARKQSKSKAEKQSENVFEKTSEKQSEKKSKKKSHKKHDKKNKDAIAQLATDQVKDSAQTKHLSKKDYEKALEKLQAELVKLQYWVQAKGLRVVVLFEGRDAAGKGGAIKRISECLNPRICRIVALPTPTEKEKGQWYFQRYVAQLPAAGEITLFDRSWYNRAGVERVMGFCTDEEYAEFLRSCPEFEHMLQRSGIILVKYWFSISDDEQEKRFQERLGDPTKRWKLSPMDLEARSRWVDYSKAKDAMFAATDNTRSPWYVVHGDDKERARLNCISHLLSLIEYKDLTPPPMKLPKRQKDDGYQRSPMNLQNFVPEKF